MYRTPVRILITVLLLATLAACGGDRSPAPPTSPTPPTQPTPPPTPPPVTWSLSGSVVSQDQSGPVGGARVEIIEGPDAGRNTQTGGEGRYQLTGLREGTHTIRVSAAGFDSETRNVTLSADQAADFALRRQSSPPSPGRTFTGTIIDSLSDGSVGDARVTVEGLGVFTTGSDGTFQVESPDLEMIRTVTISSPVTVPRTTHLRIPGPDTHLTMIPTSFDLTAFDQMLRPAGRLQRWVSAPRLVIQTRVLQFTNVTAQTYTSTDRLMSDDEVKLLLEDLNWGVPLLTDAKLAFAAETRETAASNASVRVARPDEIVVARFTGLQAATGFWGYGRWASDGQGTIAGGIVMLDADFDSSGSQFRRSLRVHELGHAFGYNHVTARQSVMNASARIEPNEFDRNAVKIGFMRPPGNRTPDLDPDAFTSNVRTGALIWFGDR